MKIIEIIRHIVPYIFALACVASTALAQEERIETVASGIASGACGLYGISANAMLIDVPDQAMVTEAHFFMHYMSVDFNSAVNVKLTNFDTAATCSFETDIIASGDMPVHAWTGASTQTFLRQVTLYKDLTVCPDLLNSGENRIIVEVFPLITSNSPQNGYVSYDGAGIQALYDDGESLSRVVIEKSATNFIWGYLNTNTAVPDEFKYGLLQEFEITPASYERDAYFDIFAHSVTGPFSHQDRKTSIEIRAGEELTVFTNQLESNVGDEFTTKRINFKIPANADKVTFQIFSRDDKDPNAAISIAAGETGTPASYGVSAATLFIENKGVSCSIDTEAPVCIPGQNSIKLSAAASADIDGGSLSYLWNANCDGAVLSAQNAEDLTLSLEGLAAGESKSCQVYLTVSDGLNAQSCQADVLLEGCAYQCVEETASSTELRRAKITKRRFRKIRNRSRLFAKKITKCGGGYPVKAIKKAERYYDMAQEVLESSFTSVLNVCENSVCTEVSTKAERKRLRKLATASYINQRKIKLKAIKACNSTHSGNTKVKSSVDYRNDVLKSIKKLTKNRKQCS